MTTHTRIAAIIIQDGNLLMQIGTGYKELWTPGGKIKENETDEECLQRELKEEMGVEIIKSRFFKEYQTISFYNSDRGIIERLYIAEIKGEIKPDAEIEEIVWLTKEDFESKKYPMIPHNQEDVIPDLIKEGIW